MGEYTLKKLAFILGVSFLLILALACEVIPLFMIMWETRGSDAVSGGRGWVVAGVVLGAGLLLALMGRGKSAIVTPKVIKLGYDRVNCDGVIMHHAGKAEARRTGRNTGAPVELVTPSGFDAAKLDYDARLNLDYIKAHPESGITIKKRA